MRNSELIEFPEDLTQRAVIEESEFKIDYEKINKLIQIFIDGIRSVKEENRLPVGDFEIDIKGRVGVPEEGIFITKSECELLQSHLNTNTGWKVSPYVRADSHIWAFRIEQE